MTKQTEPTATVDGAFLRALQEHNGGKVLTDLSEAMRKAVEAARNHGKTASLSLDVTFSPNGNAIAFAAEVSVKLPKPAPYAGVFFYDDANNLFRNDPMRPELPPLRALEDNNNNEPLKKAINE